MADRIEYFEDVDALSRGAAVRVADWLKTAIAQSGEASLVLAGGSTPKKLHAALVSQAGSDGVDWSKVTILFGDERAVGPDHDDSNFKMAAATLIEPLPAKPKAVHRMKGELGHVEAAQEYETLVPQKLDVVLLGMGEDAHTASLFPGRPEVETTGQRVIAAYGPKPPPERISLTLDALNSASQVGFLVSGAGKAVALAEVLAERSAGVPTLPSARVQPTHGEVTFFVDAAAAGR